MALAALKFCFKTCVAMKFVDDDDDDDTNAVIIIIVFIPLVVQGQGLKTKKKIKSKCGMARGPDRRAK